MVWTGCLECGCIHFIEFRAHYENLAYFRLNLKVVLTEKYEVVKRMVGSG